MSEAQNPTIQPYQRHVFVCTGPKCAPGASEEIYQALEAKLKELKIDQRSVRRSQSHCFGICQAGPLLLVYPEGVWYHHVTQEKLTRIIDEHLLKGQPIKEWTL